VITRRRFATISATVLTAVGTGSGLDALAQVASAPSPANEQPTVKIGLLMTYTGQFTDPAAQMDNGVKLYMKLHGDSR
jgi:branched-chain amino acid transport system substrate-binding protein